MTYKELEQLYREDCAVYFRTLSMFHLTRAKACEQALLDAVSNRHSDCTDRVFSSLLTDFTYENDDTERVRRPRPADAPGAKSLFQNQRQSLAYGIQSA